METSINGIANMQNVSISAVEKIVAELNYDNSVFDPKEAKEIEKIVNKRRRNIQSYAIKVQNYIEKYRLRDNNCFYKYLKKVFAFTKQDSDKYLLIKYYDFFKFDIDSKYEFEANFITSLVYDLHIVPTITQRKLKEFSEYYSK